VEARRRAELGRAAQPGLMIVLGLSAYGGTSAAALVSSGVPVAALREERLSGKKHDAAFPLRAARACLRSARLEARALDAVVFYEKPLRRFERTLVARLRAFPRGARGFADELFLWLGDRLWIAGKISAELGVPRERVFFTEHHLAHAACAFLTSPCDEAAILIADGEGEWSCASLARGGANGIEMLEELSFPNSLALLSSAIASFCGLESRPGEPLLCALATHGEPRHAQALRELIASDERGAVHLPRGVFALPWSPSSGPGEALRLALGEPRLAGSRLRWETGDRRDADVAASWQCALEESVLRCARELHARTGLAELCFGGELAWNSALVRRLALDGPFRRVCVPLDPGDAGAALGAALHASLELSGARPARASRGALDLGEELRAEPAAHARRLPESAIGAEIARRLARGQLVGWMRGRSEWGARALGRRSLLADASSASALDRLRRQAKRREAYVPFAAAFLEERAADWIEVPPAAHEAARHLLVSARAHAQLAQRAPALVAGDGTTRPQLVARAQDPLFHELLCEFAELRGLPFVLHTSLNQRADVSVRSESEALALMARTGIDALVVEDRLYEAGA